MLARIASSDSSKEKAVVADLVSLDYADKRLYILSLWSTEILFRILPSMSDEPSV
jgi:hypothetical protein